MRKVRCKESNSFAEGQRTGVQTRFQSKPLVTKPTFLTLLLMQFVLEKSSNPALRLGSTEVESTRSRGFLGSDPGSAT